MASNKNLALYGNGQAFIGAQCLFDITELTVNLDVETLTIPRKNSEIVMPTGQPIKGRIQASGLNFALLSILTGGTVATGSLRPVHETLTKDANAITFSQTPESTDHILIVPVGERKEPLVKVANTPGVGQYSISTKTVSLNASQTETSFECWYFYSDGSNGKKLTIGPDDLPASFEIFGSVKIKDIYPDHEGELVINLAKCRRTSTIEVGGGKNQHKPISFDFSCDNSSSGDVEMYYYTAAPA